MKCGSVRDMHRLGPPSSSDKVIKEIDDYINKHPDTPTRRYQRL